LPVAEPIVVLGFLRNPVDFKAVDDRPVRIVFVLLSHSVRQHLQILSRLAFVLHDPNLKALLEGSGPAEAILNRMREIEAEVWPGSATSPSPARDGSGGGSPGNQGAAGK
jgi:PTS system nitrogen regulatory IIA component